jgi:hypothetical protein
MTCDIRDSDWGDCVRNSPGFWVEESLMAGVLISMAVSQRSSSSSTILACGLRTAKDLALPWPMPEDLSRDRAPLLAGEAVPGEEELDWGGPIGIPL